MATSSSAEKKTLTSSSAEKKTLTRSRTVKTLGIINYKEDAEFASGVLPTRKDVLQNMLYLLRPSRAGQAQRSRGDAAFLLAEIIQEHWLFCNLYTIGTRHIKNSILKLYEDFVTLLQTRKQRQNQTYNRKVEEFNKKADQVFDIFCEDTMTRKRLEQFHGVKMTDMEWDFLLDQRAERKMYCEAFVDRKWMKTMERRRKDMESIEKMRSGLANKDVKSTELCTMEDSEQSEDDARAVNEDQVESDIQYSLDSDGPTTSSGKKRRRVCLEQFYEDDEDDMPPKYRHIRDSERKVRPEFYETVDKLKSSNHMSQSQVEAAVVTVGNKMFGRTWKLHNESSSVLDLDTLPETSNIRQAGKSIEALALHEIVKEIMDSDERTVVTYSDDGLKKQGAGSFSVQGVTVNGKYRSLPTMKIASETRENLASLKVAILNILEAASGVDSKALFEKIDFVITDQTAHNFGVEAIVAEELDSEHNPDHLFCNVHPSLMFNRVITKKWTEIEGTIGSDKIYSSFLVNATTTASSVTEQALDCMTRLINHDFDHKPWNKSRDFDIHIDPKQNKSVSLKDERFNRLTLTCAITLFHLEDIASFLRKYEHVTNQLACIVRCFLDLDFLKVMYCAGALIGLHLVEPFLSLTTSTSTTYSKLIPAFQQLYLDLSQTDAADLLQVDEPVFSFISTERFQQTRYDDDICQGIMNVVNALKPEVTKVLQMMLPKLAAGFQKQKGDIFGFGDHNPEAAHSLTKMDSEKLDQAPIHNLDAERSVGFVNYELSRRGAKQLGSASSAQVKCKSADLIERRTSGSFKDYTSVVKAGGKIPEVILAWNAKQEELQKKGLESKEIANLAVDRRKHKDLDKLKTMGGPFTSADEVDRYLADPGIDADSKLSRLYLEVRYARDTSLSLPKVSDIFRLMKDHKKLPITTYATNIKLYLNNVTSKATVTLDDFNQAVDKLLKD